MKQKFLLVTTVPVTLNFFRGQVNFLNDFFDVALVSSAADGLLKEIGTREKVGTHAVEMERDIAIIKDLKSLFQLVRLFKQQKPAIVHGNTPKGGLLSMIASWAARVPHRIYFVHGLRYEGNKGLKGKILLNFERLSCYLATDIVAVSHGIKKSMAANNITQKEIKIIANGSANGIIPDHFSKAALPNTNLRETYGIQKNSMVFGFVGRIVKDKGINELVTAFLKVHKKYAHTKLLLVGWYEENLDPLDPAILLEINNNPNIIAVGAQADVRPFLTLMDVFVFPSYREGFGVSIMEAAAMELPVISSNISGCNELIEDGYNGILVTPKSENSLKQTMIYVLEHPEELQKMGAVSRARILEKYNQKLVWEQALQTYGSIAEK